MRGNIHRVKGRLGELQERSILSTSFNILEDILAIKTAPPERQLMPWSLGLDHHNIVSRVELMTKKGTECNTDPGTYL